MKPNERNKFNMATGNQKLSQNFTNKQIYTKGFEYGVNTGNANTFEPNLGGKARFLYGINLFTDPNFALDLDKFSLTLNSEIIVDNVIHWTYNPTPQQNGNLFKKEQYFEIPRLLSGSDSVQLNYTSINTHLINIVFYLSDVRPDYVTQEMN